MKKTYSIFILLIVNLLFSQNNSPEIIVSNKVKEVRILNANNEVVSVAKYDNNGRLIFTSADNFTYSIFLKTSKTISYNDDGKINKIISTHSSFPEPTVLINNYDLKGNLMSIVNENGKLVFKYFYDETNFKIKEQSYNDKNKIEETITYEKSLDGKKITEMINGDFIKKRKNISFFDNDGNKIKSESYDSGKLYFSTESVFLDSKIVKNIYFKNTGKYGENYYYDDKKRLSKRELFSVENDKEIVGNSETFEYFDNGLIKKYIENIYSIYELGEFKYEYQFLE
jgi:hypothetical protein